MLLGDRSVRLDELGPGLVAATALTADNEHEPVATLIAPGTSIRVLVNPGEEALVEMGHAVISVALLTTGALVLFIGVIVSALIVWVFRHFANAMGRINAELEAELETRIGDSLRARNALIFGLAELADYRDNDTGEHLERISTYVGLLAERLRDTGFDQIDDAWIESLCLASSLHDIGKVGIPDAVLLKPGRLDEEERRVIEQHTLLGADTLIAIRREYGADPLIDLSCQIALYHHERWDGTGYPYGLSGESIPLPARIVSVADVYDALTSQRVYKPAMPHEKAARLIREGAGTQFDPAVVAAFEAVADEFERRATASRERSADAVKLSYRAA